jgi:hypothetical protein
MKFMADARSGDATLELSGMALVQSQKGKQP